MHTTRRSRTRESKNWGKDIGRMNIYFLRHWLTMSKVIVVVLM